MWQAMTGFRLLSYNIRKAIGTDWRRDPQRVLEVVRELRPDIAILQEADRRLPPRPSALPLDVVQAAGFEALRPAGAGPSLGWHGNAILVRPGISVERIEGIDLPGLEPRGALAARLLLPGGALRVTGAHLGLLRRNRREQLTALLGRAADAPEAAQIMAGDFNEWSRQEGLGRLARRFEIHAPGRSFHASLPMAALDRIATMGLVVRGGGVGGTALARKASDHLPIWLDLDFA
ncbi:MAG: endonuclease/exonuclease/phosphatase family protein [Paracoccus sp. (in: a-proteobacteria)]|uniref:endonuclease/exonuclease/phosphatase family protein n=1 Tax=Paracoccus sp. TaxID=267 RepID=UPI0026DEB756|nr:endonuclease/exonuclease/phosphatase family protein [Paracoccus sp. (in: a-proteobacteria)]MDO5621030.1 endonuclease/exonuclease/phosphatase family protein [Paracoccus sp. (in: a-proteobacteria)]